MTSSGKPLSELKRCLTKYPQAQRNLKVKEKPPLADLPAVMKLVGEAEKELCGKGSCVIALFWNGAENSAADRRSRVGADRSSSQPDRRGNPECDWSKLVTFP